jgi:hypothetical protein
MSGNGSRSSRKTIGKVMKKKSIFFHRYRCAQERLNMAKKHIPAEAITIRTYEEVNNFAKAFAEGKYPFLAIVGTGGLGKSQTFKKAMKAEAKPHHLIKGNASAFILYQELYNHRDEMIVIDDADTLYTDKKTQPLLKCLLETEENKTVAWRTKAIDDDSYPRVFTTRSKVAILCNEWMTVSHNMKAIVSRGIFLNFVPTAEEVHREVAERSFLKDDVVYAFVEKHLGLIGTPDMRKYDHISKLRKANPTKWQDYALNLLNPNLDRKGMETVSKLLADPSLTRGERIAKFMEITGLSRHTYNRYKNILEDAGGKKTDSQPVRRQPIFSNHVRRYFSKMEKMKQWLDGVKGKDTTAARKAVEVAMDELKKLE